MKNRYTEFSSGAMDLIAARFRVLGEPMRLKLLQELAEGEKNVTQLVRRAHATQANVSKHLAILLQNGMVYKRRVGVSIYYGISDESIERLCNIVCGGLQKQFASRVKVFSS